MPTHLWPSQERLETGSQQKLGAAFKFCSFFCLFFCLFLPVYGELGSPLPSPSLSNTYLDWDSWGHGATFVHHIYAKSGAYAIRDPHVASHMSAWSLWAKELMVSQTRFWTATSKRQKYMIFPQCVVASAPLMSFSQEPFPRCLYPPMHPHKPLCWKRLIFWLIPGTS